MPGLKSTYARSILILNLFFALLTLAPEALGFSSLSRVSGKSKFASEAGSSSTTPFLRDYNRENFEGLGEEDVPDQRQGKKIWEIPAFISEGMSGFQQLFRKKISGLSQLPRTKAIKSPVPEGFSIPESRVRELETSEFSWAQDTLLQYRSLIEFAQKDNRDWSSTAELPDFYDTLSKKLQESSISAVSLPEKIEGLDQLIYVDREMKELGSNIEQEVRKILNLLDQPNEQINSIRINSGSPASPLKNCPDLLTVVGLFGSNTSRDLRLSFLPQSQLNQLCKDLSLKADQVHKLIHLHNWIMYLLTLIKGPVVTEQEYEKIVVKMEQIHKVYLADVKKNTEVATKQLLELLAPFPFLYLQLDSAEQLFTARRFPELIGTKDHRLEQAWQNIRSPDCDIFANLKAVLEEHKPESLLERRQRAETTIKTAYDHARIMLFNKQDTEVSWEQVMYRIKLFHSVRADLFPKDEKAAQVEFLLNLYSPANSFGFDSQHEVESLGLKSLDDLSELRATVGRFQLATRQKWRRVQLLRSVTRRFADIDLPLFIKSLTETLENSLRSRVPPAESTTLLS